MSEPDSRYDVAHGSTAAPGGRLPHQPAQPFPVDPRVDTLPGLQVYPSVPDGSSDDPLDDIAEWEDDGAATPPDRTPPPGALGPHDQLGSRCGVQAHVRR